MSDTGWPFAGDVILIPMVFVGACAAAEFTMTVERMRSIVNPNNSMDLLISNNCHLRTKCMDHNHS